MKGLLCGGTHPIEHHYGDNVGLHLHTLSKGPEDMVLLDDLGTPA